MKMNTLYAALCGAFLLGAATLAPAETPATPVGSPITHPIDNAKVAVSADYRASKEQIEADYKAAKANCAPMSGNAKDVCVEEAKCALGLSVMTSALPTNPMIQAQVMSACMSVC